MDEDEKEALAREAELRYNRARFTRDIRRYGRRPPTPQPLPEREPVKFDEPTKYEERNGG